MIRQYLPQLFTIALLHFLAVVSPGPDFLLISKNSLVVSRKAGVFSALGLCLGITVHVTYSLLGVAYIISKSIVLFSAIKLLGAGYLMYIGWKSLRSKPNMNAVESAVGTTAMQPFAAVRSGFLTNVLNPKASLFFFAVFTQVVDRGTPLPVKIFYGLEMSIMTFAWFSFVAFIISHPQIKSRFAKIQRRAEQVMGGLLILLGIKVALSKAK